MTAKTQVVPKSIQSYIATFDNKFFNNIGEIHAKFRKSFDEYTDKNNKVPGYELLERDNISSSPIAPFTPSYPIFVRWDNLAQPAGDIINFEIPYNGDLLDNMFIDITVPKISMADKFCYVNFPAHKLIKNVILSVNSAVVAQYPGERYNMYYDTELPSDKKDLYRAMVGEDPIDISPQANIPWLISSYSTGYQAYKTSHEQLKLTLPILFWFCGTDNPLHMWRMKKSQLRVTVELNPVSDIIRKLTNQATMPFIALSEVKLRMKFLIPHITFIKALELTSIFPAKRDEFIVAKCGASGQIDLSSYDMAVEDLTIGFRPATQDPKNLWYKNAYIDYTTITVPAMKVISGQNEFVATPVQVYTFDQIAKALDVNTSDGPYTSLVDSYAEQFSTKGITGKRDWFYVPFQRVKDRHGSMSINPKRTVMSLTYAIKSRGIPVNMVAKMSIVGTITYSNDTATFLWL